MVERSTISQVVQLGVESVPGTAVAATKQLLALSLGPSVALENHTFQPKGGKYPTIVYNGKEWSTSDVGGDATYSEMQYPLASVVTTPTTSQLMDSATATGAYQWVFDPTSFGADTPKTYTVEQGSAARAHRASNFIITSFDLNWDRKGVGLGGSAYATAIEDGITLTSAGVTSINTVPIQPTHIDIFLDPTSTGLGTTKLTRVLRGNFHIADRFNPLFVVDSAQPSFVAHVETDPNPSFKLLVEADTAGMAMLTTMRAGTTKFLRFRATGPKIYSGATTPADVYNSFTLDCAGKVSGVSKFEDSDGVYAVEFTFTIVHDAGWGRAYKATLVNGQATL
jgi:hypothetical protein